MEKIDKCPLCGRENPALTLSLLDPQKYYHGTESVDNRTYALVCLECGDTVNKFTVDNTIIAVKALLDSMDGLYGESYTHWSFHLLYQKPKTTEA